MEDLQSNLLSSTIDTLPNQTSHRAHTTPHPSNPHAQLTSNSDHEHHHITSHLSSINLTDQPAVIQHDGPVKRISKHTAIRGKKLNDTLPTHFESSSANRSSTSKTTASSSSHRIETGLMPSNQKPLEIDAGHVRAIRNDNRSSQDLNRLRTRMESNGSIMLHQQPNQGSLGHVSHLSRARADQQVGNRPLGASIEQSRNIASTSINLRNRRKNVTQKSFVTSKEEAILAEQINHNITQTLTDQLASRVPILPDGTHDIGKEIFTYASLCAPSPYVIKARQYMIADIGRRINSSRSIRLPSERPFEVVAFGSTQFNLDSSTSDLDLCICDPHLPFGPKEPPDILIPRKIYDMRTIAQILSHAGFKNVCPITSATVPIVKFRSPDGTIAADLNCNNLLGCLNSALLKAYNDLSPGVFRPMGMAIKLWAKSRGICDPSGSLGPTTTSSYTLILMLIGYLQSIGHLPNLQNEDYITQLIGLDQDKRTIISTLGRPPKYRKHKRPRVEFIQHDATFIIRPPLGIWKPKPIEDLSVAFLGFFEYYDGFEFDKKVVSIRSGKPCDRRRCDESLEGAEDRDQDQERLEKSNLNVEDSSNQENSIQDENLTAQGNSDLESEAEGRHLSKEVVTNQPKSELSSTPKQSKDGSRANVPLYYTWKEPIAVEDPFIRTRNTSKNIRKRSADLIKMEIQRARKILQRGGGIVELCEWHELMDGSLSSKSQNGSKGKEKEGSNERNVEPKLKKALEVKGNIPIGSTLSGPTQPISLPTKPSMSSYPPLPSKPRGRRNPHREPTEKSVSYDATMRGNEQERMMNHKANVIGRRGESSSFGNGNRKDRVEVQSKVEGKEKEEGQKVNVKVTK